MLVRLSICYIHVPHYWPAVARLTNTYHHNKGKGPRKLGIMACTVSSQSPSTRVCLALPLSRTETARWSPPSSWGRWTLHSSVCQGWYAISTYCTELCRGLSWDGCGSLAGPRLEIAKTRQTSVSSWTCWSPFGLVTICWPNCALNNDGLLLSVWHVHMCTHNRMAWHNAGRCDGGVACHCFASRACFCCYGNKVSVIIYYRALHDVTTVNQL